jgi:16S rRNA (uracil1498-N3)-methyltransferase
VNLIRVYCPQPLTPGKHLTLDEKTAHRLINVLRLTTHDEFQVFNEQQGDFFARIQSLKKKEVILAVGEFIHKRAPSLLRTHLVQGISRGDRMDYTLQKATELGVSQITPLITAYTPMPHRANWEKRRAQWYGILVSASEQCGRTDLPVLSPICTFPEFVQQQSYSKSTAIILEPESRIKLTEITLDEPQITFLIGGEGGFAEEELQLAHEHNIIPVCLGPLILRTETVAPVVLSILQARFGDFA